MVIDLKVLFKNKTKYTQEIYKEFLEFHTKRYHLQATIFNVIIIALILFLIVLQVAYKYYSIAILSAIIFTGFCLYRYFHPIEEVNKDYHSNKITKEQSFTFSFYNTYFKVFTKREYSVIYYRELYKIFETDTFFYLYLDNRHSLLLDKSGFKKGTPITFRDFIKKKCPFKYKLDKIDNQKKETKKRKHSL